MAEESFQEPSLPSPHSAPGNASSQSNRNNRVRSTVTYPLENLIIFNYDEDGNLLGSKPQPVDPIENKQLTKDPEAPPNRSATE